jgi:hypothetical protein
MQGEARPGSRPAASSWLNRDDAQQFDVVRLSYASMHRFKSHQITQLQPLSHLNSLWRDMTIVGE